MAKDEEVKKDTTKTGSKTNRKKTVQTAKASAKKKTAESAGQKSQSKKKAAETKPAKDKILVIDGAAGFVGRHMVENAIKRGYKVRAADLSESDMKYAADLGAEILAGDLFDREYLKKLVDGSSYYIHVAGLFDLTQPYLKLYNVNVRATENVCEACSEAGVERFVHIASSTVYGKPHAVPIYESFPKRPRHNYEKTKALGEDVVFRFAKKGDMAVSSLRPTAIYGPYSKYGMASVMGVVITLSHFPGPWVPFIGKGVTMHYLHVADVARAALFLLDLPREVVDGEAFNLGDENPCEINEILNIIFEEYGKEARYAGFTEWFGKSIAMTDKLPSFVFNSLNSFLGACWKQIVKFNGLVPAINPRIDGETLSYFSVQYKLYIDKLKRLGFEYEYPNCLEGLKETMKWYQENGWIPPAPPGEQNQ